MVGFGAEESGLAVLAVKSIRQMRGGAQSQLMLCDDERLWVVKFQNNPQHLRVLANELIAARLAEAIGLTVPKTDIVNVPESALAARPDMCMKLAGGRNEPYLPGQQFGSAFVGGLMPGLVVDYLPPRDLVKLRNVGEFAGILAFDKWTANCDGRQAVFSRTRAETKYRATFIDFGFCFNAGEWDFPDAPLRSVHAHNEVYAAVTGWASFEPWLSRIETMEAATLSRIAEAVPPLWYGGHSASVHRLMRQLLDRRGRVRELIVAFGNSHRQPFPLWS